MRIIPVIDLLGGKVVHAIAGDRERYKPIKSVLTKVPDPLQTARAFLNLGLKELYIADLDAILTKGDNLDSVGLIASESGTDVMVDAGFRIAAEAEAYVERGIKKIVLATETLESFDEVRKAVEDYGLPVVASIDLKDRQVITNSPLMRLSLTELIWKFEDFGVSEIIILSLDRMGTFLGPNYEFVKKALGCASVPVLVGGGVSDIEDIRHLKWLGVTGTLVATALHKGAITKDGIDRL